MKMENIVEIPEMNLGEFRNSLGGALALYMGITFVSFFEVIELIVRSLWLLLGLQSSKGKQYEDKGQRIERFPKKPGF